MKQKRFLLTSLLVIVTLLFLGFFQENSRVSLAFQSLIVTFVFFLVIPVLYCKIVLKEPLKNLGWQRGNMEAGLLSGLFALGLGLAIIFFLTKFTPLAQASFFPVRVETNFWWFLLYELFLVSFTVLLYEVFFRGLVQLLWLGHLGLWSVIAQAGILLGLLILSGDITWQTAPLLLFAPLAGLVAYFSRSLWYSWATSWLFFFLTDIFLLKLR